MKARIIMAFTALAIVLVGCAGKPAVWETDFDTAAAAAQEQNKNMLILFTGIEWDGVSQQFKTDILDSPKFASAAQKFILVSIDIPADPNSLTPEEMEKKYIVLERYQVQNAPTVILADKAGNPFDVIMHQTEMTDPAEYAKNLKELTKLEAKRTSLRKKITSATGVKKVKLIDELFEATSMMFRDSLMELMSEVPTLDPNNETGLLGKYELQLLFPQAIAMLAMGDPDSGAQLFIDFTKTAHGAPEDNQQAYFMAAYFKASTNKPVEEVLALLQQAYDTAPESKMAPSITQNIEMLKSSQQPEQPAQQ